ncbi:MAG TPA: hypothetical protein VKA77_13875, partial [Mycobacterium sp.]|nr:hypothetical protein [Mycobacterium sp.]
MRGSVGRSGATQARSLIRGLLTVALATGLWTATAPTAMADVETLMVPSAAMGRDIPVAFSGGG